MHSVLNQIVKAAERMPMEDKKEMLYIIVSGEGPGVVSENYAGCAIILENCKEDTITRLFNFVTSKKL
jgi:hypothetical protein